MSSEDDLNTIITGKYEENTLRKDNFFSSSHLNVFDDICMDEQEENSIFFIGSVNKVDADNERELPHFWSADNFKGTKMQVDTDIDHAEKERISNESVTNFASTSHGSQERIFRSADCFTSNRIDATKSNINLSFLKPSNREFVFSNKILDSINKISTSASEAELNDNKKLMKNEVMLNKDIQHIERMNNMVAKKEINSMQSVDLPYTKPIQAQNGKFYI